MSEPAASLPAAPALSLEDSAQELARTQQPLRRADSHSALPIDVIALSRSVERARLAFRVPDHDNPAYQKAAEWFLDNPYLVMRTVRQAKTELEGEFRLRLPHVESDELPRVLRRARAVVGSSGLDFDEATLCEEGALLAGEGTWRSLIEGAPEVAGRTPTRQL